MKTLFIRIGMLLAFVAGLFVMPASGVSARSGGITKECTYTGSCAVLRAQDILDIKALAKPWNLYLTDEKSNHYSASYFMLREPNPAGWIAWPNSDLAPSEVHINTSLQVDIPQMGLHYAYNTLGVHVPGYLQGGEIPLALPSNKGGLTVVNIETKVDWTNINYGENPFVYSYSFDDSLNLIVYWSFVPEMVGDELVLHIFDVQFMFLQPVISLPSPQSFKHDDVAKLNWQVGDKLVVLSVNRDSRVVEKTSLKDTDWGATWEWVDSYVMFRFSDAKVITISENDIMAEAPCTTGCYTQGIGLKQSQIVYVDGSMAWSMATGGDILWLTTVDIAHLAMRQQDWAILEQRAKRGELSFSFGTVAGVYNDKGSYQIQLSDGSHIELPISYAPPVGTDIAIVTYKNVDTSMAWPVMALFDNDAHLWFFNTQVEYGVGFDAVVYSTYGYVAKSLK